MSWWRRWKSLAVVYALVGIAAAYEIAQGLSAKPAAGPSVSDSLIDDRELVLLHTLYPDRRETNKHLGRRYLSAFNIDAAIAYFERAIAADPKDEELLRDYAFALSARNRDPQEVAKAIARWRRNFPYSGLPDPTQEADGGARR